MESFKDWYLQQSPREQLLLGVGAIAVVIFLVYAMVWVPLVKSHKAQLQSNKIALEQRETVRNLGGKILGFQQSNKSTNHSTSLTQEVHNSLSAHGLSIDKFQPIGSTGVRIHLAKAPLSSVFAWLDEVENKKGMQIKDISVASSDDIGQALVNLRLYRD